MHVYGHTYLYTLIKIIFKVDRKNKKEHTIISDKIKKKLEKRDLDSKYNTNYIKCK